MPKPVRDALALSVGDEVVFRVEGERAVLARMPDFLELGASIQVPAAKRNVAWDEVIRRTRGPRCPVEVSAFIDTNVLIRHLTGDPAELAARATAFLTTTAQLMLPDLIVAETVCVLESFYEAPRAQVAQALRSSIAMPSVVVVDAPLLFARHLGVRDNSPRLRRGILGGLGREHRHGAHRVLRSVHRPGWHRHTARTPPDASPRDVIARRGASCSRT